VLDIGCGASAYFLSHAYFKEKHGLDQLARSPECRSDVLWHTLDLNGVSDLPFASEFFSTITMLAVVEHLNPDSLVALFREIHRTLKPGGVLIITTPAASTAALLRGLARLGLVSPEEIREHKFAYTLPLLGWYFGQAGFPREHVRFGRFEFGLNLWAVAQR
jgi:SAM-dependent methyltransferase